MRSHQRPPADAAVVVASREVDARTDPPQVAGIAAPGVEVPLLDQQRGVLLDHVAFGFDVAVREADLVVGGLDEFLAQPHVERRVVEVAPGGELRGVEAPQYVGDFVFDHVAAVGEVLAAEVGHEFELVAPAEDVGVGESDHRPAFGIPSSVNRDGPAVARGDGQVDARRVEGVGQHRDVDVGDVAARADQLFVAHDQFRIERVARFEKQVAADDTFAGEAVGLVGGAFEPVASGVEDLPAVDGDFRSRVAAGGFRRSRGRSWWCRGRVSRKASCRACAARRGGWFSTRCCRKDAGCGPRRRDSTPGRCRG